MTLITVSSDEKIIKNYLEAWRTAWEGKQIEQYIAHYHPRFYCDGKDIDAWRAQKKRLSRRNQKISVDISNINILISGEIAQTTFNQKYVSDHYSDQVCKRLEFAKSSGDWKILSETAIMDGCV